MTFRNVIVAFDGSPQGEDALALALRLRAVGAITSTFTTRTETHDGLL